MSVHARVVIGADRMHSPVAQLVNAPTYEKRPASSCAYYTYWSGVPVETVELYARPERFLIAAPTNDGLTITIIYWPQSEFASIRTSPEASFLATLDLVPILAGFAPGHG